MKANVEELKKKLIYVKINNNNINLEYFPDFFIVGPQRTGTSWLYKNLDQHPQIFMSKPKELFFFNKLRSKDDLRYRSDELSWYLDFFMPERFGQKMLKKKKKFRKIYLPKVRGEATASYSTLDPEIIKEITILNPNIKIILLIRNPIDRAWSHAKKELSQKQGRALESITDDEFKDFFNQSYQLKCARYTDNIDTWSEFLSEGNIFIGFFDDMKNNPEQLLFNVFSFLGVEDDQKFISSLAYEKVNSTEASHIPRKYKLYLEELLKPELEKLEKRFGQFGLSSI